MRTHTANGIVEELAMEATARALAMQEGPLHPAEVENHLICIITACRTICSYTSGLRTSRDKVNARLALVLGSFLLLVTPAYASEILSVASANIGRGETIADNRGAWVQVYTRGEQVSWCAAFVSYVLKESHVQIPYLLRARDFLKYGKAVNSPKPGDIAIFSRGAAGHVGIVKSVISPSKFYMIEGNHGAFPAKVKVSLVDLSKHDRTILGFRRFSK